MLTAMPNYVGQLPGVKERKDEVYTNKRVAHIELMADLQAGIECDIGFEQMTNMVRRCLRLEVPETSPMFAMQCLFELRATHQQVCIGPDCPFNLPY